MDELDTTHEEDRIDKTTPRVDEPEPLLDLPLPAALRPEHGASLRMSPLPVSRAADGTRQLSAAPPTGKLVLPVPHRRDRTELPPPRTTVARGTVPPPIPARASRASVPPPIPASARIAVATIDVVPPVRQPTIDLLAPAHPSEEHTTNPAADPTTSRRDALDEAPALPPIPLDLLEDEATPLPPPMPDQLDDEPETLPAPMRVVAPEPVEAATVPRELPAVHVERRELWPAVREDLAELELDVTVGPAVTYGRSPRTVPGPALAGLGAALVIAGIAIGYTIKGTPPAARPAPVAAAASAPTPVVAPKLSEVMASAPVVAPPKPPEPRPARAAQASVAVTSTPSGAEVTLIDNGKATYLGVTPLDAAVDPSRSYDVMLALPGRPTQIAHLDPRATTRLALDLAPHHEPLAEAPHPHHATSSPHHAQARIAAVDPVGSGTLMISTKPPCSIILDGKTTKLMTPQRSLPVAAGAHKVTLVNPQQHVNQTVTVQVAAHQPTKLIRDFMKK